MRTKTTLAWESTTLLPDHTRTLLLPREISQTSDHTLNNKTISFEGEKGEILFMIALETVYEYTYLRALCMLFKD
jgi:hypothetical protein